MAVRVAGHRLHGVRLLKGWRGALPFLPVLGFVAAVVLIPVGYLFAGGLANLGSIHGVAWAVSDPLAVRAVENSLTQGTASSAASVLLGFPLGVLIGRYRWSGRSVTEAVLLVPFLLPTLVVVQGVQGLVGAGGWLSALLPALGPFGHGFLGIVFANTLYNTGLVAVIVAVAVEAHGGGPLEDAVATLGGGPFRTFRDVWGRPALQAALAGGLLTFVFSALGFAAPLLLCGPRCFTLEVRVWELAQALAQPAEGAILALAMVAMLSVPTALYLLLLFRLKAARSGRTQKIPIPFRRPLVWPLLAVGGATLALVGIFLGTIVVRALSASTPGGSPGSAFVSVFGPTVTSRFGESTWAAVGNTLFYAGATVGIVLLLGIVTAYAAARSPRLARVADGWLFAPLLVSPVVLSFALATFWRPLLGGESSVWLLILLSQATLALPFTLQSLNVAAAGVSRSYSETARSLGSPPFQAFLETELPWLRGALRGAGLFAFALALGEFTATYFLAIPRFATLTVELYALDQIRLTAAATALGGLLVLVSLGALVALSAGGRRIVF